MGGIFGYLLTHKHQEKQAALYKELGIQKELRQAAEDGKLDAATGNDAQNRIESILGELVGGPAKSRKIHQDAEKHRGVIQAALAGDVSPQAGMAAHTELSKGMPAHLKESFDYAGSQMFPAPPGAPPPAPSILMNGGSAASPSAQVTSKPAPSAAASSSAPQQLPSPPQMGDDLNQSSVELPPPPGQSASMSAPPQAPQTMQAPPANNSGLTLPGQSPTPSMPPAQVGSNPSAGFGTPLPSGRHYKIKSMAERGQGAADYAAPGLVQGVMASRAQSEYNVAQAKKLGITDPKQLEEVRQGKTPTESIVTAMEAGKAYIQNGKIIGVGPDQIVHSAPGEITTQVKTNPGMIPGQAGLTPPPQVENGTSVAPTSRVLAAPPALLTPTQRAANQAYADKRDIKIEDLKPADYPKAEAEYKELSRTPSEIRAAEDAHNTSLSTRATQELHRAFLGTQLQQLKAVSGMSEDAIDIAAKQKLAGQTVQIPRGPAGAVLLAKISNRAAEMAKANGDDAGAVVQQGIAAKSAAAAYTQVQKQEVTVGGFAVNADKNFKLALNLSSKVDRTGSPIANRWLLKMKGEYAGDQDVTNFENALDIAVTDWAKVSTGTTSGQALTDTAKRNKDGIVSAALSGKSLESLYKEVVVPELKNRKSGFEEQKKELQGIIAGRSGLPKPPGGSGGGNRGPAVGTIDGGHRFKGGDPAQESNWEKVRVQ
jgi:hypothetical protein